ncbi:hypothetical protein HDU67_008037 [Dinochytrium kinnereticum]|nr:hypothetical protein HDU67_008037 [Dinochytrium kinnereticum]
MSSPAAVSPNHWQQQLSSSPLHHPHYSPTLTPSRKRRFDTERHGEGDDSSSVGASDWAYLSPKRQCTGSSPFTFAPSTTPGGVRQFSDNLFALGSGSPAFSRGAIAKQQQQASSLIGTPTRQHDSRASHASSSRKRRTVDMDESEDVELGGSGYLKRPRKEDGDTTGLLGVFNDSSASEAVEDAIDITNELHHVLLDSKTGALIPFNAKNSRGKEGEGEDKSSSFDEVAQVANGGMRLSDVIRNSFDVSDFACSSPGLRSGLPPSLVYPDRRGQVVLWKPGQWKVDAGAGGDEEERGNEVEDAGNRIVEVGEGEFIPTEMDMMDMD